MILLASIIIALCALPIDDAATTELPLLWQHEFPDGIEWAEPAGGDKPGAVLVCTRNARVDLLDAKTGRTRLERTIGVQAGARYAGESGGVAYLFGYSTVSAIDVIGDEFGCGLAWQLPEYADAPPDDDPEFLTRITAACPTPQGVFVVMNDGNCVELKAADGAARRTFHAPPSSFCDLFVSDNTAVLHQRQRIQSLLTFIDLSEDDDREAPPPVEFEYPPPLWSTVTRTSNGEIVFFTASANGVVTVTAASKKREFKWPGHATPTATTICLTNAPNIEQENALRLNVALPVGGLWIYDPIAGRVSYDDAAKCSIDKRKRSPLSLKVFGQYLVERGEKYAFVYRAGEGRRLSTFDGAGAVIDAWIEADALYALTRDRQYYALSRQPLKPHEPPVRRVWRLDAGDVRNVLCLEHSLVIVEAERIRAYTLP